MILKFANEQIYCAKVEKGIDSLICYDNQNNIIVEFKGISDFSMYILEDGNFTNIVQELTESEMIMLAITDLDAQMVKDKLETQLAIAELTNTIIGGTVNG